MLATECPQCRARGRLNDAPRCTATGRCYECMVVDLDSRRAHLMNALRHALVIVEQACLPPRERLEQLERVLRGARQREEARKLRRAEA